MAGPHLGVLIVGLQPVELQELVQLRLGVLHAPVAVDAGVDVYVLLLGRGRYFLSEECGVKRIVKITKTFEDIKPHVYLSTKIRL